MRSLKQRQLFKQALAAPRADGKAIELLVDAGEPYDAGARHRTTPRHTAIQQTAHNTQRRQGRDVRTVTGVGDQRPLCPHPAPVAIDPPPLPARPPTDQRMPRLGFDNSGPDLERKIPNRERFPISRGAPGLSARASVVFSNVGSRG